MGAFRLSPFWQALLIIAAAYLLFRLLLLPRSLMLPYLLICAIGLLLYYSFDDARWAAFKTPLRALLRDDDKAYLRWSLLLALPLLAGYQTYRMLMPTLEAPLELRQMHPAPPATLQAYGQSYDLERLENPLRQEVLELVQSDRQAGWARYNEIVADGRDLYYQNCLYCHGALLDGLGHYSHGFEPRPVSFQDPTILPQLQESYLFWRIVTGGPGLPREGAPWNSAMPAWEEMLTAQQVWQVITFIFDYTGHTPRIWNPDLSRAVAAMQAEVQTERAELQGRELYRLRCEVCHGEQGMGDGPVAELMDPRPRDFSLSLYKYKTSPGSLPARDEDLFHSIKWGLPGTAMPGWASLLSDTQIRSLIPVLKGFDIAGIWAPEEADESVFDEEGRYTGSDHRRITEVEPLPDQIAYSPESVSLGRAAYAKVCRECHGETGRGNSLTDKRLEDDWGNRIWPRDLSKPWTWRTRRTVSGETPPRKQAIQRIYSLISLGIPGTPMPSHRAVEMGNPDPVSLEDRWHIANYVFSLGENRPQPAAQAVITSRAVQGDLPTEVDDPRWETATAVSVYLLPNVIQDQRLFTPLNDSLMVRALHNRSGIAFLLELHDRTESRPGTTDFSELQDGSIRMPKDALALQFPASPALGKPHFLHGDEKRHTRIWYWSPGSEEASVAPMAAIFEGAGPDSTPEPKDSALRAAATWGRGEWRVVMSRSFAEEPAEARVISEGRFIPIAFANWDGSNGEIGSQHTLSGWHWLFLPPQRDPRAAYALAAGVTLLILLAGFWLLRRQSAGS